MMKTCSKCKRIKALSEFHRKRVNKDGRCARCRECASVTAAKCYSENPEPVRRQVKDYYAKNRDAILVRGAEFRADNRELVRVQARENASKHRTTARSREKYYKHKEKNPYIGAVRSAVRSGRLVRPEACSECGGKRGRIEGHHNDYSKPLDVVWLCSFCHHQRHKKIKLQEIVTMTTIAPQLTVIPKDTPRRDHFHVSNAAAICGLGFGSEMSVWLSMVEGIEPEFDEAAKERMKWGNNLEGVVADEWLERNAESIPQTYFAEGETVAHPKYPWLVGTPDRLIRDKASPALVVAGLEVKTAGLRMADKFGESGSDEIPDYYLTQVALYCSIFNLPKWEIAVLIGGQEFRQFTYTRNEQFEAALIARCEAFYNDHVLAKVPPSMDGSAGGDDYLKSLFPIANQTMRDAEASEIDVLHAYRAAYIGNKEAEAELKPLKQQVKEMIGDSKGLLLPNGEKITYGNVKGRTSINYKAVMTEFITYCESSTYTLDEEDKVLSVEWIKNAVGSLVLGHTNQAAGHRALKPTFKD